MKGFNFFSIYGAKAQKKRENLPKRKRIIILSSISLVLLISIIIYVSLLISVKRDISNLEAYLNSQSVKEAIQVDMDINYRKSILMQYEEALSNLEEQKKQSKRIETALFNAIIDSRPSSLTLNNISINDISVNMTGNSDSKVEIASFISNLKSQSLYPINDIFLSNIVLEENIYSFNIELKY